LYRERFRNREYELLGKLGKGNSRTTADKGKSGGEFFVAGNDTRFQREWIGRKTEEGAPFMVAGMADSP